MNFRCKDLYIYKVTQTLCGPILLNCDPKRSTLPWEKSLTNYNFSNNNLLLNIFNNTNL